MWSWPIERYFPRIFLEKLRKTTESTASLAGNPPTFEPGTSGAHQHQYARRIRIEREMMI